MKSHKNAAGLIALLVALLAGSLAAGDEPGFTDTGKDDLREEVRKLRDEIADLKKMQTLRDKVAAAEYRALQARLEGIEKTLDEMKSSPSVRRSASFDPAPLTGTIRIENRLPTRAEVIINNVGYSIRPFSTQQMRNRPAGPFVYEVTADGYGVTLPKRTSLGANETWTLTIY